MVLTANFTYVGNVTDEGEMIKVTECKNIRAWGTTKGLGQLRTGPTRDTVLDDVGTLYAPKLHLISLIEATGFEGIG